MAPLAPAFGETARGCQQDAAGSAQQKNKPKALVALGFERRSSGMSALRLFMQGIKRSEQAIGSLLRRGPSDRIRTCGCAAQAPAQPGGNLKRDAAGSRLPFDEKRGAPGGDSSFLVRVTGFEPAASCSQSRRATSCATPGKSPQGFLILFPAECASHSTTTFWKLQCLFH